MSEFYRDADPSALVFPCGLIVEPGREICLEKNDKVRGFEAMGKMLLRNGSRSRIRYRLKSSMTKYCAARNSKGVLDPGTTVELEVMFTQIAALSTDKTVLHLKANPLDGTETEETVSIRCSYVHGKKNEGVSPIGSEAGDQCDAAPFKSFGRATENTDPRKFGCGERIETKNIASCPPFQMDSGKNVQVQNSETESGCSTTLVPSTQKPCSGVDTIKANSADYSSFPSFVVAVPPAHKSQSDKESMKRNPWRHKNPMERQGGDKVDSSTRKVLEEAGVSSEMVKNRVADALLHISQLVRGSEVLDSVSLIDSCSRSPSEQTRLTPSGPKSDTLDSYVETIIKRYVEKALLSCENSTS